MRRQLLFLVCAVVVAGAVTAAQAPAPLADGAPSSLTLWYRQPAQQWDHAMPIGNGRLGAMVFGSVNRERIQLNESSLWMGGRLDRDSPDALKYLPEVRRLLFAGAPVEAYTLAERHLMGRPQRLQSYQTLGDLRLTFDHEEPIADYRRELDLDSGIARVIYRAGNVLLTREIFASHPDQAIVVRITAAGDARFSTSVWIDRSQDATTAINGNDRLDLVGHLAGGKGLAFQASVKVAAGRRHTRHLSRAHPDRSGQGGHPAGRGEHQLPRQRSRGHHFTSDRRCCRNAVRTAASSGT